MTSWSCQITSILLMTVNGDMSIEKAVQFIKGGFSYRLKKETGYTGVVWQKGFSEVRVNDEGGFAKHREYIAQNPVERGHVSSPEDYPYCFTFLAKRKVAGAKAQIRKNAFGTVEAVP